MNYYEAIRDVFAPALTPFTADHVAEYVGVPDPEHAANAANNAVGSAFARASREGIIRPTGKVHRSKQPHRRGGMIREWIGT